MKKFILGIVSIIFFIPIIESLSDLFCYWIEIAKAKATKKILIYNNEIETLQAQLEPQNTSVIGFQIPSETEYDDEEWEDDKIKNKMGFV